MKRKTLYVTLFYPNSLPYSRQGVHEDIAAVIIAPEEIADDIPDFNFTTPAINS